MVSERGTVVLGLLRALGNGRRLDSGGSPEKLRHRSLILPRGSVPYMLAACLLLCGLVSSASASQACLTLWQLVRILSGLVLHLFAKHIDTFLELSIQSFRSWCVFRHRSHDTVTLELFSSPSERGSIATWLTRSSDMWQQTLLGVGVATCGEKTAAAREDEKQAGHQGLV